MNESVTPSVLSETVAGIFVLENLGPNTSGI